MNKRQKNVMKAVDYLMEAHSVTRSGKREAYLLHAWHLYRKADERPYPRYMSFYDKASILLARDGLRTVSALLRIN